MGLFGAFNDKSRDILREPIYLGKDESGIHVVHEYQGPSRGFAEINWVLRAMTGNLGKDLDEIEKYNDSELENEFSYSEMLTFEEFSNEMIAIERTMSESIGKAVEAYRRETGVDLKLTDSNMHSIYRTLSELINKDVLNETPDLFLRDTGLSNDARDFISNKLERFKSREQIFEKMENRVQRIQEDLKEVNLDFNITKEELNCNKDYEQKIEIPKLD